ncbi:MAG: methyltransferase domain-containing protein, partial [Thermoplasmata archaeon]
MAHKIPKHAGTEHEDDVRSAVREHYKELALKEAPCCGSGKSTMCGCSLYSESEVGSIPSESASVSAGCGNPTAIAGLEEGMTVVDLGSGGGIDAFLSSKKVGPKGKVYGIDSTPEMIHRARKTARENGFDNVEFRLGEIEHMPLPDGCADVIISNCVINLSPQKQQV